jgi:YidC/Oxa1 family membrane protein insertase
MVDGVEVIQPDYISKTSKLYESLNGAKDMMSLGIDLSLTPVKAIQDSPGKGVIYALLVVALMGLYFVQQRMIASRTVSPGMSATQAKIMQYLPVAFGVFQFFFPVGLVVYYISQTLVRIAQQQYITRRFYKGEHSLGQQAQAASVKARELSKEEGAPGGFFGQMKHDLGKAKEQPKSSPKANPTVSKRVTPPKGGGTPAKGKPTPSNRPKPSGQSRHPKPPRG